jgi:hypothetical protein
MNPHVDLIDSFTNLVVGADDPKRLAERTLEVMASLTNGRSAAVFTLEGSKIRLFASSRVDQSVLDVAGGVWERERDFLEKGNTFYVTDKSADRRVNLDDTAIASFAMVPVHDAGSIVALIYIDSADPHFCEPHDIPRLAKFSRIIAKAVNDATFGRERTRSVEEWETYLERTPVEDMEREKLLLLLNRNEWNIARVSRLMGVTRRTIYLRLARYNIPREKVRKSRRMKSATA